MDHDPPLRWLEGPEKGIIVSTLKNSSKCSINCLSQYTRKSTVSHYSINPVHEKWATHNRTRIHSLPQQLTLVDSVSCRSRHAVHWTTIRLQFERLKVDLWSYLNFGDFNLCIPILPHVESEVAVLLGHTRNRKCTERTISAICIVYKRNCGTDRIIVSHNYFIVVVKHTWNNNSTRDSDWRKTRVGDRCWNRNWFPSFTSSWSLPFSNYANTLHRPTSFVCTCEASSVVNNPSPVQYSRCAPSVASTPLAWGNRS